MKIHTNIFILLSLIGILASCTKTKNDTKVTNPNFKHTSEVKYAKGFTIERHSDYTQIIVRNPWDSTKILEKYILVNKSLPIPKNLPEGTVVIIPVEKVAICSAVHAGMWNLFHKLDKVVAVCEPEYMSFPTIKEGIVSKKIIDLGMHTSINLEKLLLASPNILIVSPFENSTDDRYKNAGISVVKDASWMESSPLGRSEWIKFEAAFAGEDSLANTIFTDIENRYVQLINKVKTTKDRPTVFTEKKYGDSWYISGGNSYIGQFLNDAGASYLWNDLDNTGSVPLAFETVFAKACKAQYWLIKYNDPQSELTYEKLNNEYELYANFDSFKNKNIFGLNSATTPFYEQGTMEPDIVLADLIKIFHPEIMKDYQPKYYFKIK